jgi:hypothetical protein
MQVQTFRMERPNAELPFAVRDMGGRWQFVMDNLGKFFEGCVIENKRRNKVMFIPDFKMAIKQQYTEFAELIFHKREPAWVVEIDTCNDDPGYPEQDYASANDGCPAVLYFTPTLDGSDLYSIAANSITCNGVPIVHTAVGGGVINTLAELVADLNSKVSILGTWAVDADDDTQIKLTGSSCDDVVITFEE